MNELRGSREGAHREIRIRGRPRCTPACACCILCFSFFVRVCATAPALCYFCARLRTDDALFSWHAQRFVFFFFSSFFLRARLCAHTVLCARCAFSAREGPRSGYRFSMQMISDCNLLINVFFNNTETCPFDLDSSRTILIYFFVTVLKLSLAW